jgi:hypothetical protein
VSLAHVGALLRRLDRRAVHVMPTAMTLEVLFDLRAADRLAVMLDHV